MQTTSLVTDVAGDDDDTETHGRSVDVGMAWAAHSVEQGAGTTVMVSIGAMGATASGSPIAGTRAGRWASLADAVASSVAPELAVTGAKKQSEVRRKQSEVRSIDWWIASKLDIMTLKSRLRSACQSSRYALSSGSMACMRWVKKFGGNFGEGW